MTEKLQTSPQWSSTTKLVVALTFVAIAAALLVRFNNLIAPLLIAFILSYLLHPLASRLNERSALSWRGAVNLIYLIFILVIVYLSTLSGVAAVDQFQNLLRVLQNFAAELPQLLQDLSGQVYRIGPFEFDFAGLETQLFEQLGLDFVALGEQALNVLQPILGGAGSLLGSLAASALTTIAWGAFVLIISYFILADAASQKIAEWAAVEGSPYLPLSFQAEARNLNQAFFSMRRMQRVANLPALERQAAGR